MKEWYIAGTWVKKTSATAHLLAQRGCTGQSPTCQWTNWSVGVKAQINPDSQFSSSREAQTPCDTSMFCIYSVRPFRETLQSADTTTQSSPLANLSPHDLYPQTLWSSAENNAKVLQAGDCLSYSPVPLTCTLPVRWVITNATLASSVVQWSKVQHSRAKSREQLVRQTVPIEILWNPQPRFCICWELWEHLDWQVVVKDRQFIRFTGLALDVGKDGRQVGSTTLDSAYTTIFSIVSLSLNCMTRSQGLKGHILHVLHAVLPTWRLSH